MRRLWIAAAEASGDALGARLAALLRARHPGLELRGVAGPAMAAAGVQAIRTAGSLQAFGIAEAVAKLPSIRRAIGALAADVERFDPDVLVTIDSPGLMLRLARRVRQPCLHWVAPQVWAWRAGRVPRIANSVDTLCCLLPFEPAWFRDQPVRVRFTGHPSALPAPVAKGPRIALLPGSRPQEIARIWPVFREVAGALARRRPGSEFTVGVAPGIDPGTLGGLAAELRPGLRAALEGCCGAVVCSGTAAIEVGAAGIPQVVCYATHPLTWAVGSRLVRGVEHVALPNLLAGMALVPEHLQRIDSDAVARDLLDRVGRDQPELDAILASLEPEGAVDRVADEVERLAVRG